jgi:hypothetical protein
VVCDAASLGRVAHDILKDGSAFEFRFKQFEKLTQNKTTVRSFEMLHTIYSMTQCHIPEDWNLENRRSLQNIVFQEARVCGQCVYVIAVTRHAQECLLFIWFFNITH